jgi:anti-sigma regulatory factor (Ser/Thr protein kinase)
VNNAQTLIIELPTFELVKRGCAFDYLDEVKKIAFIHPKDYAALKVALSEALTNSIEHGNLGLKSEWKEEFDSNGVDKFSIEKNTRLNLPEFAEKKVKIILNYSPDMLEVSIKDEGEGFSPESHQTSVGLESHGRGIFLIKSAMDSVEYHDNGRVIYMRKNFR